MRRQQADFGSERAGPAGQPFERNLLAHAVTLQYVQLGQQRPGTGQSHAGPHASRRGGLVGDDDVLATDNGARRWLAGKGFERKARQMQCKPEHEAGGAKLKDDQWQSTAVPAAHRHGA